MDPVFDVSASRMTRASSVILGEEAMALSISAGFKTSMNGDSKASMAS